MIQYFNLTLIVVCLMGSIGYSSASSNSSQLGGHLGWVERAGAGSSSLNLGGAGMSYEKANLPAFINPALVSIQRKSQISVGAESRTLGRRGGHLGYHYPWKNRLGFGYAMLYRGDAGIDLINSDDENVGTSSPAFIRHSVAMGWRSNKSLAYGASFDWNSFHPDIEGFDAHYSPVRISMGLFKKWRDLSLGMTLRNLGLNADLSAQEEVNYGEEVSVASGRDYYPKSFETEVKIPWRSNQIYVRNSSYLLRNVFWDWDYQAWQHRLGVGLEIPLWVNFAAQLGYRGEYFSREGGIPGNLSMGAAWRIPLNDKRWVEWSMGALMEREAQYTPVHMSLRLFW